jgi:prepilin-type N-terminal cleavage/methylation domain-containing protein
MLKTGRKIHKSTSHRLKQRGFTLIELLVSFSLVIFLIAGTGQVAVHSILVQKQGEANLKSLELACSKLEYFKSLPFDSDELKGGFQTEQLAPRGSLETFKREWRIEEVSPSLKKIEITCFALSCAHKRTRLVLYLLKELGF